jgi:transposase
MGCQCSDLIRKIYKYYVYKETIILYNRAMFVRQYKTKNKKTGKIYIKHQLVQSYRTADGPRQRVIMNLGKLNLDRSEWRRLAFALEGRLSGQLRKKRKGERPKCLSVNLEKVATICNRSLGPELVAEDAWKRLSMDKVLKDAGLEAKSRTIAKASIFARLIRPSSELAALKWIRQISSVAEIIDPSLAELKKDPLYQVADVLLYRKDAIEEGLRQKEEEIFPAKNILYLYDLTNTYFEGAAKGNSAAKRGKSKDKRSDCPLICLALLVDSRGYPLFSQVYEGNQSEPETLDNILDRLEDDSDRSLLSVKPTIVADKGIATKENIALLEKRGFDYMVVERKKTEADYLDEFTDLEGFSKNTEEDDDDTIYFKKVAHAGKARLLVASAARKEKEKAMDTLKESRFLEDAGRLKRSVTRGNIILAPKVNVRIGRLLQRYPTVAKYYDIEAETDSEGKKVLDLLIEKREVKRENRNILTGCYVIETTHSDMEAEDILKSYHSLARVESAFRSLKTDLGLRPVYHHKAKRCSAHLFISVLAYHLLNTIELSLLEKGEHKRWSTIRDELSTHMRTTVIMTDKEGAIHHIRVSSSPETHHKKIYDILAVKNPLGKVHLRL